MARNTDLPTDVKQQSGKKVFVKKISFTTTAGANTLKSATGLDAEGNAIEDGATYVLQADQDFFYQLLPATATTSVTILSGSRPGVRILSSQQEFVTSATLDTQIDAIGATASGTIAVFVVK